MAGLYLEEDGAACVGAAWENAWKASEAAGFLPGSDGCSTESCLISAEKQGRRVAGSREGRASCGRGTSLGSTALQPLRELRLPPWLRGPGAQSFPLCSRKQEPAGAKASAGGPPRSHRPRRSADMMAQQKRSSCPLSDPARSSRALFHSVPQ